jgi:hypothetical protein
MKNISMFLFVILFLNLFSFSFGENVGNDKTNAIIERVKKNPDAAFLCREIYADEASSVCQKLLVQSKTESDNKMRYALLLCAATIESKNFTHPHPKYKNRSNYLELCEQMITEFELEQGRGGTIPWNITTLFHPDDLKAYGQRIRTVIHAYPQNINTSSIVLYASLPDNNKSEELNFVKTVLFKQKPGWHDSLFYQALQARFGDKNSEEQLSHFVSTLWDTEYDGKRSTDVLKKVLLCAGTDRMMKQVALGLQSNKKIRLPGSLYVHEKEVCEDVLQGKYMDDPTFPLPKGGYSYTDQEVVELKKWCEKNLKVKYPVPTPSPTPTPSAK